MNNYLNTKFNVENKVVLLTGAGGHLVGEMSRSLAKAGMKVVCCDYKLELAEKTVKEITDAGGVALALEIDVRNKADHERALAETVRVFGQLDCVLNGAGSNAPNPFFDITLEELLNIFQADEIGCQVITVTNDVLKKLDLVGKDLSEYSLETVKIFYNDAKSAGFKI